MGKIVVYTSMSYAVDTADQGAAAQSERVRAYCARLGAAMSFALPEMIAAGFPKLREWVSSSPRLAHLGHYFDRLEKMRRHVRSPEGEEMLTQGSEAPATELSVP